MGGIVRWLLMSVRKWVRRAVCAWPVACAMVMLALCLLPSGAHAVSVVANGYHPSSSGWEGFDVISGFLSTSPSNMIYSFDVKVTYANGSNWIVPPGTLSHGTGTSDTYSVTHDHDNQPAIFDDISDFWGSLPSGLVVTVYDVKVMTGYHASSCHVVNQSDGSIRQTYGLDATSMSFTVDSRSPLFEFNTAPNTYTVNFNGNGNTGGSMASQAMTYDTAVNLRSNGFTKTGYLFDGWATSAGGARAYSDAQSVKNLTATHHGTVTLYARWTPITYKVRFDGNGATSGSMSDQTLTYDTSANLTANAFSRSRYTWKGWSTVSDGSGTQYTNQQSVLNLTTTNGAALTLFAKWERDYGYLDLEASSGIANITSGNGAYSLAGAAWGVYSDAACTKSVGTFTTDANGNADALHLPTEVYWIKQTSAPVGYYRDDTVHQVEVFKDTTSWVRVTEDPARVSAVSGTSGVALAQKLDGQGVAPQGDAEIAGCEMTVRYFGNTSGATNGTPTRSWVFASDSTGGVSYDMAHFVSGDALYVDADGKAVLPVGAYTVEETKAPRGYQVSDTSVHTFFVTLSSDHRTASIDASGWSAAGVGSVYGGRGIVDEVLHGAIVVTKNDEDGGTTVAQGDGTLAGATFTVTNRSAHDVVVSGVRYAPGSVVMRVTTDSDGRVTTDEVLPYGTYEVAEESAPVGYHRCAATVVVEVRP